MFRQFRIIINFCKHFYVEIIVLVLFIVDAWSFYLDNTVGLAEQNRFSFIFRATVEAVLVLVILVKKLYNKAIIYLIALILFPVIWLLAKYLCSSEQFFNYYNIFQVIKESNKYVFPVIVFWGFSLSSSKFKFKIFELIYILSAIIVIYAFLADNPVFYTYGTSRFGFKPMVAAHNEISLFWMVGIVYFLRKFLSSYSFSNIISLILVFIGALLLGTKAIFLFLIMLALWLLLVLRISYVKKAVVLCAIIASGSIFLVYSGIYDFFKNIYESNGLLYSLSSKRSEIIYTRVLPTIYEWDWYNYLIGGYFRKLPIAEMDLIDLFVFYGGVGCILYFVLMFNTLFKFKKNDKLAWFFVTMYMLVGGVAGHFFTSGTNAVYLAILCLVLQENKDYSTSLKSVS